MLGLMALQSETMNLDSFGSDMKDRQVEEERINEAISSLQQFSAQGITSEVDTALFD